MFADPCMVTSEETIIFLAMSAAFGVFIAIALAWIIRTRLPEQGAKVGCLGMSSTGVLAGYLARLALPDGRTFAECGLTPDLMFFPGYAFIVAPLAMLAALFLFLRGRRRG
ncbi:hypothetical protein [Novosphingobium cyanobacteriorum]|uniref:Uncharacterized protein n=1 Tax=Novosphingobium cyanobacteriorum TaxID=3024215 RepID=A0ABT6CMU0_9SPHN|nr:hypothetical protein [Novosphingobium cyanobacteriorum]MDF8334834.1 hypothetical protein [Novosphingobium cyanobacteriorum]